MQTLTHKIFHYGIGRLDGFSGGVDLSF